MAVVTSMNDGHMVLDPWRQPVRGPVDGTSPRQVDQALDCLHEQWCPNPFRAVLLSIGIVFGRRSRLTVEWLDGARWLS